MNVDSCLSCACHNIGDIFAGQTVFLQRSAGYDRYLEILPAEAEKGKALRFIESYLPVPHSHTFAAGDAPNDISMLKAAQTGIAMQNASSEVKESADMVTSLDNNHDGLLEILEKHFR